MLRFLAILFILMVGQAAHAQTPFYQGKTITIIVGTKAGDVYDLISAACSLSILPKYHSRQPKRHYPERARRGVDDRGESGL